MNHRMTWTMIFQSKFHCFKICWNKNASLWKFVSTSDCPFYPQVSFLLISFMISQEITWTSAISRKGQHSIFASFYFSNIGWNFCKWSLLINKSHANLERIDAFKSFFIRLSCKLTKVTKLNFSEQFSCYLSGEKTFSCSVFIFTPKLDQETSASHLFSCFLLEKRAKVQECPWRLNLKVRNEKLNKWSFRKVLIIW